MLFKCYPTPKELREEVHRLRNWHKKFAWTPIRVDTTHCVWLGFVEVKSPDAYSGYRKVHYGWITYFRAVGSNDPLGMRYENNDGYYF